MFDYRIGSAQVMALFSLNTSDQTVSKQIIDRLLSRARGVFQVRLTFIVIGPATTCLKRQSQTVDVFSVRTTTTIHRWVNFARICRTCNIVSGRSVKTFAPGTQLCAEFVYLNILSLFLVQTKRWKAKGVRGLFVFYKHKIILNCNNRNHNKI